MLRRSILALLCLSVLHLAAQTTGYISVSSGGTVVATLPSPTYAVITASNLKDISGTLPLNGTICFAPSNQNGSPLASALSGVGQQGTNPACANVVNGAISGNSASQASPFTLGNTTLTYPANLCYNVTATESSDSATTLGGGAANFNSGYNCVQMNSNWCSTISGVYTCNFDTYTNTSPGIGLTGDGTTDLTARSMAAADLPLVGGVLTGPATAPSINQKFSAAGYSSFAALQADCQRSPFVGCDLDLTGASWTNLGTIDPGPTIPMTIIGAKGVTYTFTNVVARGSLDMGGEDGGGGNSGANPHTIFKCASGTANCIAPPLSDSLALTYMHFHDAEFQCDSGTSGQTMFDFDVSRLVGTNIGFGAAIERATVRNCNGDDVVLASPGNRTNGVTQYIHIKDSYLQRAQGGDPSLKIVGATGQVTIENTGIDTGTSYEGDRTGAHWGTNFLAGANGTQANVTLVSGSVNAPSTAFPNGSVTFTEVDSPTPLNSYTAFVHGCTQNLAPLNGWFLILGSPMLTGTTGTTYKYSVAFAAPQVDAVIPTTGAFSESGCQAWFDSSWATTYGGASNSTVSSCSISSTGGTCSYTAPFPLAIGNSVSPIGLSTGDACAATLNGSQQKITALSQSGSNGSYSGTFNFTAAAADCSGSSTGTLWTLMNADPYSIYLTADSCQYGGACAILNGVDGLKADVHQEGNKERIYTGTMSITAGSGGVATVTLPSGTSDSTLASNAAVNQRFICSGWTNSVNNISGQVTASTSSSATITIPNAIAETNTANVTCVIPSTDGVLGTLGAAQNTNVVWGGRSVGTMATGPGDALFDFQGSNTKLNLCFDGFAYTTPTHVFIAPQTNSTQAICDVQPSTSTITTPGTRNVIPVMGPGVNGALGSTLTNEGASAGLLPTTTDNALFTKVQGPQMPGHLYTVHALGGNSDGGQTFMATASFFLASGSNFSVTCDSTTLAPDIDCTLSGINNTMPAGGGTYTITMSGSGSTQWVSAIARSGGTYATLPPLPLIVTNPCANPLVITEGASGPTWTGGTLCTATPLAIQTPGPAFTAQNFSSPCAVWNGATLTQWSATGTSVTVLVPSSTSGTCNAGGTHAPNLPLATDMAIAGGYYSISLAAHDNLREMLNDNTGLYDIDPPVDIQKHLGQHTFCDTDNPFDQNCISLGLVDTSAVTGNTETCRVTKVFAGTVSQWYWSKDCTSFTGGNTWEGVSFAQPTSPTTWVLQWSATNGVFTAAVVGHESRSGGFTGTAGASGPYRMPGFGEPDSSTTGSVAVSTNVGFSFPYAVTIKNFGVRCSAVAVSAGDGVFTFYTQPSSSVSMTQVSSGPTVTYDTTVTAQTWVQDTTHSFTLPAGALGQIRFTTTTSETLANCMATFEADH